MHTISFGNCHALLLRPFEKQESRTQDKLQFDIKRFKRDIGRENLSYRGPLLWNTIYNNLKEKENTQVFKNKIELHIDFMNKLSFKSETCILKIRLEDFYY